jgi:phytoene dehydrogenase-like protein
MHWLTGSDTKEQVNALWRYTGALNNSVVIHLDEPFMEYDHDGTPIRLYRDVDKTEKHLLELSPADAKEIMNFCSNIRRVKNLAMPVTDIRGIKSTKKNRLSLSLLFSAISAMRLINRFLKIPRETDPGGRAV